MRRAKYRESAGQEKGKCIREDFLRFGQFLRRHAGLEGVKAGLLYEHLGKACGDDMGALAASIKRLPIVLQRARPLEEAISTAGGVRLEGLDARLMLNPLAGAPMPDGVFVAGEMLDWEAPTGGYLLSACLASGLVAGRGAADWLTARAAAPVA